MHKLSNRQQFKCICLCASILLFLAIAVGAFGAHAWSDVLTKNASLHTFSLANDYQWYHGIALLVLALLQQQSPKLALFSPCLVIIIGTLLFSGSLYLHALLDYSRLALITPFGGVLLLIGWGMIVFRVWCRLATN